MFINSLKLDDIFRRKALQIGLLCSAMIPVKRFNSNKPTHTQSGTVKARREFVDCKESRKHPSDLAFMPERKRISSLFVVSELFVANIICILIFFTTVICLLSSST